MPGTRERAIALGGLYQCADLVTELAWQGQAERAPFEACITSVFGLDAAGYAEVYGGISGLVQGLTVLRSQLRQREQAHAVERTRYVVMLLHLERRLAKRAEAMAKVKAGIEYAQGQLVHFELTHINILSKLADVYQSNISPLGPKIMVHGDQSHLANPDNATRIRALLLAGIRAGVLWRQAGGSRWRLLLGRARLQREVEALLKTA